MSPTRREFLGTLGAAGAVLALRGAQDVYWAGEETDVGWAPGIEGRANSTCLVCPARCGIKGRTVDGRLVRISGNTLQIGRAHV